MDKGDNKVIDYKERYVAFIDILGFKKLVKVADTAPSDRVDIFRALETVMLAPRDALTAKNVLMIDLGDHDIISEPAF